MTRAFRLRNASGDMIDLLADLDIFGVSPKDLGVSFDHTSHLSNSNYLLEKTDLQQNEFKLSIVYGYISQDPYNAYYKLVKFLDKAPYILEYETTAGTWQREVRLKELTKSEIVTGDIMMEDFTLTCFTPWYRNVESKVDPTTDIQGDGKIYQNYESTVIPKRVYAFSNSSDGKVDFTTVYPEVKPKFYGVRNVPTNFQPGDDTEKPELYQWHPLENEWINNNGLQKDLTYDNKVLPYVYGNIYEPNEGPSMNAYAYDYVYEGWVNGQNGVFRINNDSIYMGTQKGSPVEIIIDGPATNPYWQIVKDAQILQSDGIDIDIAEGYQLIVSSVPGDQKCILISPDGTVSNVYQQQRLDLTNFVTVPPGFSELIFFNAKKVGFRMREEYIVV